MKVEDTLKYCLLTYPAIFPTALYVYDHWFMTIGNGYDWKNGELVSIDDKACAEKDAIKDAVIKCIKFHYSGNSVKNSYESLIPILGIERCFNGLMDDVINNEIIPIFNWEKRMNNFKVPSHTLCSKTDKYKFYPLSNYSRLYTIPDDVKNDWLIAAKKMVDIIKSHKDNLEDPDNLFPKIKERVYSLYNDRYNKIKYLNDIYEIIGTDTEEVGAGCHSWFETVYVCRNIKTGYERTFDHIEDMRLINL